MRLVALLLVCAGVLLAATGCGPVDKHYFTRGVGTELYPDDVANQTSLQNAYVADICRQAGLVPTEYDGTTSCGSKPYDPATWWLFVQAGMNDIDQRCDAYLTWLDNVRRSREPILNQISATRTATQAILRATGVGVDPMTIASAAFGLASDTFSNVNSRLITELDHSTVQAVVLSKQTEYRNGLIGDAKNKPKVMIASRPAAIYALRSYLRLCMPMTIETEINNTVATIARSGPDALNRKQPLISAQSVGTPLKAMQRVSRPVRHVTPSKPQYAEIFKDYTPARYPPSYVKRILSGLCVPAADQESAGSVTKSLIKVYQQAVRKTVDGRIDNNDAAQILSPSGTSVACSSDGARNYFERINYFDASRIADLVSLLNKSPAGGALPANATLMQARAKIRDVRQALSGQLTLKLAPQLSDQVTRDLINALFNLK